MTEYTPERIIKSIARELAFRRSLYPRKVSRNEMTREQMDEEIGIFEQIKADYQSRVDTGAPKLL